MNAAIARCSDARKVFHRALANLALAIAAVILVGCSADAGGPDDGTIGRRDASRDAASLVDATRADDVGTAVDVSGADAVCAVVHAEAHTVRRPIDVIVAVDTSSSVGSARARMAALINTSFADILERSHVDYRVILIGTGVTVGPPLSTSGRLFPVAVSLGSGRGLETISVVNYADWAMHLRPDSFKVFLDMTDSASGENLSAGDAFDAALLTHPEHFGTATMRNYMMHGILGLAANSPVTTPWPPSAPIVNGHCSGGTGAGPGQQQICRLTGGLRYPICQLDGFDVVFNAIAAGVVTSSSVPCDFEPPMPPAGTAFDPSFIRMQYQPGGGGTLEVLRPVANVSACGNGFYTDTAANRIRLCPSTCTRVQADASAMVNFSFECGPG